MHTRAQRSHREAVTCIQDENLCACLYACMYVCVYINTRIHRYIHTHTYVKIHTHTHTHTQSRARNGAPQILAQVREHNAHIERLRRVYKKRADEIAADNEHRLRRAEEAYQQAWKDFVDKVCAQVHVGVLVKSLCLFLFL